MLRDTFLFWRISKGGPGLPEEGGPWDTAMPAWEKHPEGRGDVGGHPLPLRFHGPEASRQGGGRAQMTSRLIGARSSLAAGCVAVLIASLSAAPTRIGARAGSRPRDRGAAGVGQEALPQVLLAVPRREGGRRRLRHPASAPQAPQLHDGQVQGSHDAHRSAPDASGPREHHQARHALHVDARLAQPHRPGSVGSRLLHHDLFPRLLQARERPQARSAPERAESRRRSPSSSGRSSTKRPAASSATARSVGATDLRLQPWWTTGAIRYARRTSRRAGPSGEARPARISSGR